MAKNIYVGAPKNIRLTNLITNGSFENNLSGWTQSGAGTPIFVSTDEKYIGSKSAGCKMIDVVKSSWLAQDHTAIRGHKYYYRVFNKPITVNNVTMLVEWKYVKADGSSYWVPMASYYVDNNWRITSAVFDTNSVETGYETFSFTLGVWIDGSSVSGSIEVYYDGFLAVDLTESFGAGNEPTREWCDKNIPYGEGSFSADIGEDVSRKVKKGYVGISNKPTVTLPSGYTQLEHIEFTGTQVINSWLKPHSNTKIEICFSTSDLTNDKPLFGVRKDFSTANFLCWFNPQSAGAPYYAFGDGAYVLTHLGIEGARHIVTLENGKFTMDGKEYLFDKKDLSSDYYLYIGGLNNADTIDNRKFYGKIEYVKIYNQTWLERDFIPCQRSDGVIGFYNMLAGDFYPNAGSGTFVAGKPLNGTGSVARKLKKAYIGVPNFKKVTLPSGYTQLEYIETNGSQYINTDFYPTGNSRVVMDARLTDEDTGSAYYFGAKDYNYKRFCASWNPSEPDSGYEVGYDKNWPVITAIRSPKFRHTIEVSPAGATVDGVGVTWAKSDYISEDEIYLFALNEYGGEEYFAKLRCYSCQIYEGTVIQRNFVPCKNASGTIGMYDTVYGVFYDNDGGGSFVAGPTYAEVARLFWSDGIGLISYYGTAEKLSAARTELVSAEVGGYALFVGGLLNDGVRTAQADAYDSSLVRTTAPAMSSARKSVVAASHGGYALLAGGHGDKASDVYSTVDAIDAQLTRKTVTALSLARDVGAKATVGDFVLFAGGAVGSTAQSVVDAYNRSLTRSVPTALSSARDQLSGCQTRSHALFAGGNSKVTTVDAYDSSLTRSVATGLSQGRARAGTAFVGGYALFAGGYYTTTTVYANVDAYDESLTRSIPTALSSKRFDMGVVEIGEYAMFAGGDAGASSSSSDYGVASAVIDAYDTSLTRSNPAALSVAREGLRGAKVGSFALFAGGNNKSSENDIVDVYTLV